MGFRAALFDFDGVVVQSEMLHMKTFMELLSPYGVNVSLDRWYREFAGTGSKHIFEVLVKENSIDADPDDLVAERKKIYEAHVRNGELKETRGVRDFLIALKSHGIKRAIVSGSHRTNVELAVSILSLAPFFDYIVSGDDIKTRKPDPGPFLYAAKKLGVDPGECLVFEDSVSGCEAARRAGMRLVVVESPVEVDVGEHGLRIADFRGTKRLLELFLH